MDRLSCLCISFSHLTVDISYYWNEVQLQYKWKFCSISFHKVYLWSKLIPFGSFPSLLTHLKRSVDPIYAMNVFLLHFARTNLSMSSLCAVLRRTRSRDRRSSRERDRKRSRSRSRERNLKRHRSKSPEDTRQKHVADKPVLV